MILILARKGRNDSKVNESRNHKTILWTGVILGVLILFILIMVILPMWQKTKEETKADDRIPYSEELNVKAKLVELEDGVIQNANPNVIAEHEFEGLCLHDVQLTQGDDGIGLLAQVTNRNKEDFSSLMARNIIFLDDQGRKVGMLKIHIDPVGIGETTTIYSQLAYEMIPKEEKEFTRFNVTYVYDYRVE